MATFLETSYSIVHQDNASDQPTLQDLRTQLEKGNDETKQDTMKTILTIMLNGDPMPSLLMHIIRFVMPSKSKPLKKLLYLYYEVCPKLDALCVDGCASLEWDHIRSFIESRLPANPAKYHTSPISLMSTASAQAAAAAKAQQVSQRITYPTAITPQRLRSIDITRCTQLSKDMIQWLRMYVADVRWETAKGAWGEGSLS